MGGWPAGAPLGSTPVLDGQGAGSTNTNAGPGATAAAAGSAPVDGDADDIDDDDRIGAEDASHLPPASQLAVPKEGPKHGMKTVASRLTLALQRSSDSEAQKRRETLSLMGQGRHAQKQAEKDRTERRLK